MHPQPQWRGLQSYAHLLRREATTASGRAPQRVMPLTPTQNPRPPQETAAPLAQSGASFPGGTLPRSWDAAAPASRELACALLCSCRQLDPWVKAALLLWREG